MFPIAESLNNGDVLSYGQVLKAHKRDNKPPPLLYSLTSEDKWPVTELKALITGMTAYEARDRVSSQEVVDVITNILKRLEGKSLKERYMGFFLK